MPLLGKTNARPPPVQAAHILPTSPCPPTPKQLQLGQWRVGGGKHSSIRGTPTSSDPAPPRGWGDSLAQHLLGVLGIAGVQERGGKKRL